MNYDVLLGTDKVSDDYGDVQYLPTTFYIGRDGTIVDKSTGLLDRKDIEESGAEDAEYHVQAGQFALESGQARV